MKFMYFPGKHLPIKMLLINILHNILMLGYCLITSLNILVYKIDIYIAYLRFKLAQIKNIYLINLGSFCSF